MRLNLGQSNWCKYYSLVGDDDNNFLPVLFDVDPGHEPLFQGPDGPPDLVGAQSGLHQEDIPPLDHQVPVEPAQPGDVRVDVVDQAHLEAPSVSWKKTCK